MCAANSGYGADDLNARRKNRLPPNLLARVLAAFFYIVPWMDITIVGWEYHHSFPSSAILHVIPGQHPVPAKSMSLSADCSNDQASILFFCPKC